MEQISGFSSNKSIAIRCSPGEAQGVADRRDIQELSRMMGGDGNKAGNFPRLVDGRYILDITLGDRRDIGARPVALASRCSALQSARKAARQNRPDQIGTHDCLGRSGQPPREHVGKESRLFQIKTLGLGEGQECDHLHPSGEGLAGGFHGQYVGRPRNQETTGTPILVHRALEREHQARRGDASGLTVLAPRSYRPIGKSDTVQK